MVGTLIDVLRTPSSDVQRSVADCLGPLMAGLAGDAAYVESVVGRVLGMLTKGSSYGDRRVSDIELQGALWAAMSGLKYHCMFDGALPERLGNTACSVQTLVLCKHA